MSLNTNEAAAPVDGTSERILEIDSITKTFGGVTALSDVSLHLGQAEVVAIVGDNGAGKSTLMKTIAGVHSPTSGRIVLSGQEVEFSGPRDSRAHGIEVVYQDLALVTSQEVYMNMFLGREKRKGPFGLLDKRAMKAETQQILDELDVRIPSASALVEHLSGGQRQGIAIGRATHWATQFVLMDEPTAALGVQETGRVEEIIRRLRERGRTVLMVSHNLDQVFRLSDRVYVLRRGTMVAERTTAETTGDEIVSLITGVKQSAEA